MGVPGFFTWLKNKYKKDNFILKKQQVNNVDYLLFDANGLVHPVCREIVINNPDINNERLETKMYIAIIEYMEKLIDLVDPKVAIYVAIDGVAPCAKIKQQRMRRFKSVADKILDDKIRKKHNKNIEPYWNTNAITPGTNFMEKLDERLIKWAKDNKRKIIYSSWKEPGEGEHKLLHFMKDLKSNDLKQDLKSNDLKHVIYGLDADLIFLALSADMKNIFLMREANQMDNKGDKNDFNFVSIDILKESIIVTMGEFIENLGFKFDNKRLINDFIFLCYFLGNDFLPHLPALDIHKSGIEYLIINYGKTLNEFMMSRNKVKYLLKKTQQETASKILNKKFLLSLLTKLALKEEETLKENYTKGKRFMRSEGDAYQLEKFKIEHLQFKIEDPIAMGSDNMVDWRERYYRHYYGVEEDLEEFVEKLVEHYLMGIKWVTIYYFDNCPGWEWYFPFDHPPFLTDIVKYFKTFRFNKFKFTKCKALEPVQQLLTVLPPQSHMLLPEKFRKLMTNTNSSLAYLYPTEFTQDFINKTKYWMAIPNLPPLDIQLIKHIYEKYKN